MNSPMNGLPWCFNQNEYYKMSLYVLACLNVLSQSTCIVCTLFRMNESRLAPVCVYESCRARAILSAICMLVCLCLSLCVRVEL